jgi:hypothetical protein
VTCQYFIQYQHVTGKHHPDLQIALTIGATIALAPLCKSGKTKRWGWEQLKIEPLAQREGLQGEWILCGRNYQNAQTYFWGVRFSCWL